MAPITLPSGAVLKITLAPFADSKRLYQAILAEIKSVKLAKDRELSDLIKEIFCIGFSSPAIDAAMAPCMARCLYNDVKLDGDTFEPEAARGDYMSVCAEVIKANVTPFMKSLYAEYERILLEMPKDPT